MKRRVIIILMFGLIVFAALAGFNELDWKWGTLGQQGPFKGEAYTDALDHDSASQLGIGDQAVIQVVELDGENGTILLLDSPDKKWAIRMVGFYGDDELKLYPINKVKLRGVRRSETGYKVLYSADWEVSGSENGIIFITDALDLDYFTMR